MSNTTAAKPRNVQTPGRPVAPALSERPSGGTGTEPAADQIDLLAIFTTIWRGKLWIILACTVFIFAGGVYGFRIATPMYTANAVVTLENREGDVTNLTSVVSGLGGDQTTINTEVEVLRARSLAAEVVDSLELMRDPEFNPSLQPANPWAIRPLVRGAIKAIIGLLPGSNRAEPGPPDAEGLRQATIDRVMAVRSVSNLRGTYVFWISVTTTDPLKSATLANALADTYIQNQLEAKFEGTERATSWLTERVSDLQTTLEEAEQAYKEFDASTDLISPEALAARKRQVKDLRQRAESAAAVARTATAGVTALRAAATTGDRARMAEAVQTYTHETLWAEDETAGFDDRFAQILERAGAAALRARGQASALAAAVVELSVDTERQGVDLVTLRQLKREAEASRLIYEYFLTRLKETSVQRGIQSADSRILTRADVPRLPSAPRKALILVLFALLGLIAGTALVLLREMMQNTFRTSEDLEHHTGYPVLGQIPTMPLPKRGSLPKYLRDKPSSAAVEALRNLRTTILLSDVDEPPQVIVSTSSIPGEGKTTQSLGLAQNLAAMGRRVLLIEGDLRRRVYSEYMALSGNRGLVSILTGEATVAQVLHHDETLGLDVLPGEPSRVNAADLYSSDTFRSFLAEQRAAYDFIIIDTPPVLLVPDARVIAQEADAVIFAVKWDSTPKTQVRQALNMFRSVGIRVTGLVLAQVDPKGMKRYGYGEYSASGYYQD